MDYSRLVSLYDSLESTSRRLEKTCILSKFLKEIASNDVEHIMLLIQGKAFPSWDESKLGFSAKLIIKALQVSTGISTQKINDLWRELGDLGTVAETLVRKKTQSTLSFHKLTTKKVFANLRKLTSLEGKGSVDAKIRLIAELLANATPTEARYIIRTVLEDLRVGLGEGTLRDAIVWAVFGKDVGLVYDKKKNSVSFEKGRELYNKKVKLVQNAYDITNDFAEVAKKAKENKLDSVKLVSGRPVKVMLAQKVSNVEEGFDKVGRPCAVEYKYDGFRMEIHKKGKNPVLYTRRLEDVTDQFPDVVEAIKRYVDADSFILDSEVVGIDTKTKNYLPFQKISQRIRRKYDISKIAKEFPVEVNVFDIIYLNGKNLIKNPLSERREIIDRIIKKKPGIIMPSTQIITSDDKEAESFYQDAVRKGFEGVMFKKLKAPYKPGSRVGNMVKLKPVLDMLDLVIVGAEWGEGKRSGWLSSFTVAARDEDTDELLSVGKVATGFKEKDEEGVSFNQMTKILKNLILSEKGREVKVKPEILIEVRFEEIQKSPTYSSGYALRFPRFNRLRSMERSASDCNTIQDIEEIYYHQRGRNKH